MTTAEYQKVSVLNRWLIVVVVMSATLMQVIDTTIVNVALPHMQGSLGASPDEITWTLTSYLVASAICMPLTGYFSDRFGRKRYVIISITGFTLVSALCGASTSLTELIVFRMLQGVFGAALVPLSQAILADVFPPKERGQAMAIWGIGVMVGPILGPTLGGYLTEVASWRWTFYVNVPVGIFALLLSYVLPNAAKRERTMDWLGLLGISLAVGGTQFVLDRGTQDDWFNSPLIRVVSFIAVMGLVGFVLHNFPRRAQPVFDIRIFKDKNFVIAAVLLAIFGLGLYGIMVVQPMMMEGLLNYPPLTTGLILAPRGISGMLSMILVSRLINYVDPRWLIITGIVICVTGMAIATHYTLMISTGWLMWPLLLQGFGLGMVFVPLSTIAFSTLPVQLRTEAAGLFSLLRTMGGAMGISIAMTVLTRHAQMLWNHLGGYIHPYNMAVYAYLKLLHLSPAQPLGIALLTGEMARQANMVAFINVFAFISWSFMGMIPLALLLKKQNLSAGVLAE
ncbi:MAG: multidrug MFS transporter [Gammaproteobacteria bacterium RIFCSPHIGHO2_12_FULL_41_20]|nr:MAG: multidrug MFS transporter [Gammaproteobacteria bacterium RIFCSPHIGHO2_12_FULL_41_20]